ncbi:sortase, partial [Candidatus Dojkabacteria bacterium]|nr:sortase [Candidatus Dojkabacteria bacterium]
MYLKGLKYTNLILSFIVFFLGMYITLMPVIPEIKFSVTKAKADEYVYPTKLAPIGFIPEKGLPKENRLVIPQIGVDGEINEGDREALDLGLWHRPGTSNPVIGGNTVIVAHRFLYSSGPITFYHLDKMKIGDEFSIYWEGEEYVYKVFDIFEVNP